MGREWLAIYSRLIRHRKFVRLSEAAKLALFYVWCLAGEQDPEASWSSQADLAADLTFYGVSDDAVTELVAARWLDVEEDGVVWVHDWDDHQYAASKAVLNKYKAAKQREWRRRKAGASSPFETSSPEHITGQEITGHRSTTGRQRVGNEASAVDEEPWVPSTDSRTGRGDPGDRSPYEVLGGRRELPEGFGLGDSALRNPPGRSTR